MSLARGRFTENRKLSCRDLSNPFSLQTKSLWKDEVLVPLETLGSFQEAGLLRL